MKRYELTLPLRVGPWWFGMLMIVPLLPLMLVAPFCEGFAAFGRSAMDEWSDLRVALEALWTDRK